MPRRVRGNVAAGKHHLQKKTPGEALWQKANVPPVDDANVTVVAEPWVMRSVYEAHLQDEILSPAEQKREGAALVLDGAVRAALVLDGGVHRGDAMERCGAFSSACLRTFDASCQAE